MEEIYQEPETVIQQLRLLLAASEEEIARLRGGVEESVGDGTDDSVASHVIQELEEKKEEISELTARLEALQKNADEEAVPVSKLQGTLRKEREKMAKKLARLTEQMEEKERKLEEMGRRLEEGYVCADESGEGSGGDVGREELIVNLRKEIEGDREKMAKRLAELTGQLEKKEIKLEELGKELEAALTREEHFDEPSGVGGEGEIEIFRLRDELNQAKVIISQLEAATSDEVSARAEVDQLREEMETVWKGAEGRVAELQGEMARLEQERDEALSRVGEGVPEQHDSLEELSAEVATEKDKAVMAMQELTTAKSRISSLRNDLRRVGEEYQHSELSYRTAQAWLHRLGIANGLLKAACVGLAVFLIFTLAIKGRRGAGPDPIVESVPYGTIVLAEKEVMPPEAGEKAGDRVEKKEGEKEPSRKLDEEIFTLAGTKPGAGEPEFAKPQAAKPKAAEPEAAEPKFVEPKFVKSKTAWGGTSRVAYTVKKGDSLWSICMRELGDPEALQRVVRDNKLANPHALRVGEVIYLSQK